MNSSNYDEIDRVWSDEIENEALQDLEDLKLGKMVSYLSKVRLTLAGTKADRALQAELLTQEALNLEFMLRDLLMLRRMKILKASIAQRRPTGNMTLAEEELFNRLLRGFEGHLEFVNETLAGTPASTITRPRAKKAKSKSKAAKSPLETEYILVQFQRPIEDAFLGLDESTYGPFEKDDVATIPAANARIWLRDGTVVRILPENLEVNE